MHITNRVSYYFGLFAKTKFPSFIQKFINISYVKLMGLDMTEFKHPKHYKSLNELFTRKLELNREIRKNDNEFISPTDSLITQCGEIKDSTLFQIKGMDYNLEELLTYYCSSNFEKFKNGSYMNFYLSPKDYHRYHATSDFIVKKLIHIPGKLYPVNLKFLRKESELFIQNERVVLECEYENRVFYMVFIGALNVGQMVFEFEPRVETNTNSEEIKVYEYENIKINKADCLGYFKMGSTVVILWEEGFVELEELLNKDIKYGDRISTLKK